MTAKLINVFSIPADKEEEFLAHWKQTTSVFSRSKGFIEANLHRNTGIGNQTFLYINIAQWESPEAWRDTHAAYTPTEYHIPGVVGHPAVFEVVLNARYQGD